jgi:ABC-type glycerol-3-phosphate transport system substrate-binding protein
MNLDVYTLLKTDVFIDLKNYIRNDKSYPDLNMSAMNGTMVDNQIKSLPLSLAVYYLAYNNSFLNRLGISLDPKTPIKWSDAIRYAIDNPVDNGELFFAIHFESILTYIIGANMPDFINMEEKTINLKQEWFIELIDLLKELKTVPNTTATEQNNINNISTFAFFDTSDIYNIVTPFSLATNEDGVYPMFRGEINENKIMYPLVMYSISANSTKQQEAWDFLSFMLEADQQAMNNIYGAPVNFKGMNQSFDVHRASDEIKEQARQFTENIDYTYDFYGYRDDISGPIMQYIDGKLTMDEALDLAEENVIFRLNE